MKHTPGPWLLDDEGQIFSHAALVATVNTQWDGNEGRHDWDQTMTDGALLAAAPELYEALRAIVAQAERNPFNPIGHVLEHFVPLARAAINKAEGK